MNKDTKTKMMTKEENVHTREWDQGKNNRGQGARAPAHKAVDLSLSHITHRAEGENRTLKVVFLASQKLWQPHMPTHAYTNEIQK